MNNLFRFVSFLFICSIILSGVYGLSDTNIALAQSSDITAEEAGQLIEILIAAGAIAPDKVATARALVLSLRGGTSSGSVFARDLTVGSTGQDVLILQRLLNRDTATRVANSGNGSSGSETTYFGEATKIAVIKFQQKYGISPATGYIGALTRQKLNEVSLQAGINTQNAGLTLNNSGTVPFVDIRVGTLDGTYIKVATGAPFTLVWTSKNVTSCVAGPNSKPVIGTQTISGGITKQTTYSITCTGPNGTASDYVVLYNDTVSQINTDYDYTPYTYTPYNTTTYSNPSSTSTYAYVPDAEDAANRARYSVTDTSCTAPCVDLKIDGQDTGPYVMSERNAYKYTLSWLGKGVKSCKLYATSEDNQFDVKDYYATNTNSVEYLVSSYSSTLGDKEVYKMSFPGFTYGESVTASGTKSIKLPTPKNLKFSIKCENKDNPDKTLSDSVDISFTTSLLPYVDLKLDGMDRITLTYNDKFVMTPYYAPEPGPRKYVASWSSKGVTSCIADSIVQFHQLPSEIIHAGWSTTTKPANGTENALLSEDPDVSRITLRLTCDDGYVSDRNSTTTGVYKGLIDYVVSPYNPRIHSHICPMDGFFEQGKDLIDPAKITWPKLATDVGTWPITAYLQNVTVNGGVVTYPHDKADAWVPTRIPGVGQTDEGVYGHAWAITPMGPQNPDGTYNEYVANFTGWMNPGQISKSTDELQGPGKVASLEQCPGGVGSTCENRGVIMQVPAYYGFMVSTLAKGGFRSPSDERSNIVVSACTNIDLEQFMNGSGANSTFNSGSTGGSMGSDWQMTAMNAASGATTGAIIGTLIMPGIGTSIGAGVGSVMGGLDMDFGW